MNKYTVLLLRPDWQHEGPQSDWIFRAHVMADSAGGAVIEAQKQWAKFGDEENPDDAAALAVFNGHIVDVLEA